MRATLMYLEHLDDILVAVLAQSCGKALDRGVGRHPGRPERCFEMGINLRSFAHQNVIPYRGVTKSHFGPLVVNLETSSR